VLQVLACCNQLVRLVPGVLKLLLAGFQHALKPHMKQKMLNLIQLVELRHLLGCGASAMHHGNGSSAD
jgi:hypothetical protein